MTFREEKYKKIVAASEKARNDEWYSARHEVRMAKIEALRKEDEDDWDETRKKYLKEDGLLFLEDEPDPFKRVLLRFATQAERIHDKGTKRA